MTGRGNDQFTDLRHRHGPLSPRSSAWDFEYVVISVRTVHTCYQSGYAQYTHAINQVSAQYTHAIIQVSAQYTHAINQVYAQYTYAINQTLMVQFELSS